MELNQDFLDHQSDDVRSDVNNEGSSLNDSTGENPAGAPRAQTFQNDKIEAENKGWENNRPGATGANDDDQRVESLNPQNNMSIPGPDDDDYGDEDDDDDELIPIETDDDDDFLGDDDDDDVDDIVDEKKEIPQKDTKHHHHNIDISHVTPSEDRPFGRTSGRMIDHEPGTTNNPG